MGIETGAAKGKAGLLDAAAALWPSLPFMAYGLWGAWSALTYSGSLWLSDNEVDGTYLSQLYIVSTVVGGATFLVSALLARRGAAAAVAGRRAVVGGGIAACAACLLIVLAGPYYLQPVLGVVPIRVAFWVGAAATGVGTVLVGLRCGVLYGSLPPRRTVVYAALAQLVAAFVYLLAFACPSWAPVEHGPSLASIVFFCGLPLAAAALACVDPPRASGCDRTLLEGSASSGAAPGCLATRLPPAFWRFAGFVFLMSLCTSLPRSSAVSTHALASTLEGNDLLMVLRTAMALGFAVYGIRGTGKGMGFGKMCSLLATAAAVLTACAAALGGLTNELSLVVYFFSSIFEFVTWCLLAFVVVQKRVSPVLVFGLGRGAFMLGCGAGWMLGYAVMPLVPSGAPTAVLFMALAGVMLLLALGLFSEKDYERLFLPVSEEELSLEDLFGLDRRAQGLDAGGLRRSEKRGRFSRAVDEVARTFTLSAREAEVLRYLAMGYGSDRIADAMQVKVNTVRAHTHNVYVKLNVHSREELMRLVDDAVARQ